MNSYDKNRWRLGGIWVWGVIAILVCSRCQAQGTQSDYQRMAAQSGLSRDLVVMKTVRPNWLSSQQAMWYYVQNTEGQTEYKLVTIATGQNKLMFSNASLAKLLTDFLKSGSGEPSERTDLGEQDLANGDLVESNLDRVAESQLTKLQLWFGNTLDEVFFRHSDRYYRFELRSGKLSDVEKAKVPGIDRTAIVELRTSVPGQRRVNVTFRNQKDEAVDRYWVDVDGKPVPYGTIEAGSEGKQDTYQGHIWLFRDQAGKNVCLLEVEESDQILTVQAEATVEIEVPQRLGRIANFYERGNRGNVSAQSGQRRGAAGSGTRQSRGAQRRSPDGMWGAQVRDFNLVITHRQSGESTVVSSGGDAQRYFNDQFFWSPDSKYVVALQEQPAQEHKVFLIESSPKDQLQPKLQTLDYLKPGDRIPTVRPYLFQVESGKAVEVSNDLFSTPWSVSEIRWMADSSEFTFRYNQRGHQVMRVVGVKTDGQTRAIVDEQSPTFIDYSRKSYVDYLDQSGEIVWASERDGWNHLYLYDQFTGQVKNRITQGQWVVREVLEVDRQMRQVWFTASGIFPDQDPYYLHHCHVDFDGSNLVVMTQGDGDHRIEYSPDQTYLVDTYSRVDMPPVSQLRRVADGQLVCSLEEADWQPLLEAGWQKPERFTAKGRDGQTDIHGVIYRPSNFDASKQYPIIEYIYAGPQDSYVPKSFSTTRWEKSLAELGFIVVQIDGMGTSNRSKAFHDVCWKNLGDGGFPDRIMWMNAAARKYPNMDLQRVGIFGGSAGGQNAAGAVFAFGEFYKVAVADCGCHDNRMDKIWWNEQWMGWPIGEHYSRQSNVTLAGQLQGKLFLIVGELDRNVDPASTMQVVDALIKADKDFDLLVVPGGGHGIGSSTYGRRRTADFFVRHLLGVEPREN